jgi:hypothetical protein
MRGGRKSSLRLYEKPAAEKLKRVWSGGSNDRKYGSPPIAIDAIGVSHPPCIRRCGSGERPKGFHTPHIGLRASEASIPGKAVGTSFTPMSYRGDSGRDPY